MKNLSLFCFRTMSENGNSEFYEYKEEADDYGLDESVAKNLDALFQEGIFQKITLFK